MSWLCTTCDHYVTLANFDVDSKSFNLATNTGAKAGSGFRLSYKLIRCPNAVCNAYDLAIEVREAQVDQRPNGGPDIFDASASAFGRFQFLPATPSATEQACSEVDRRGLPRGVPHS